MNVGCTAVRRLRSTQDDFARRFETLLGESGEDDPGVESAVRAIITEVRRAGDAAVLAYTRRFDGVSAASVSELRVPATRLDAAWDAIGADERAALTTAADRIRAYHERQRQESWHYVDEHGSVLGQKVTPLDRVGVYVPGGKASYPSSVLMNTLPARVAGVAEITMAVPAPSGELNPLVLAAARVAGVDEVLTIGGAQASRRARVRNPGDSRGGQDCRTRQSIRRRREASRVRRGRHRHDCRTLRDRDSSATARRRWSGS